MIPTLARATLVWCRRFQFWLSESFFECYILFFVATIGETQDGTQLILMSQLLHRKYPLAVLRYQDTNSW
jgi:hypothetical protein